MSELINSKYMIQYCKDHATDPSCLSFALTATKDILGIKYKDLAGMLGKSNVTVCKLVTGSQPTLPAYCREIMQKLEQLLTETADEPDSLDTMLPVSDDNWERWSVPVLAALAIPRPIEWIILWTQEQHLTWDHVRSCLAWLSVKDLADVKQVGDHFIWAAVDSTAVPTVEVDNKLRDLLLTKCDAWTYGDNVKTNLAELIELAQTVTKLPGYKLGEKLGKGRVTISRWLLGKSVPTIPAQKELVAKVKSLVTEQLAA